MALRQAQTDICIFNCNPRKDKPSIYKKYN